MAWQPFTFGGVVQDSGSLTKSGTGLASLSGTQTYTGNTTLSAIAVTDHNVFVGAPQAVERARSRKLIVIPGWRYKLIVAIGTRLPLSWRLWMERQSPHAKTRGELAD